MSQTFQCKQCGSDIPYKYLPDGERFYVECSNCGAVHQLKITLEINQVQQGYKLYNKG